MSFELKKSRMYHLPHNAIRVDEFNFLLQCINVNKGSYTAKELQKLFFISEVKANKFEIFHSVPNRNFTNAPSDKRDLRNKLTRIKRLGSTPSGMNRNLFRYLKTHKVNNVVEKMIRDRYGIFELFKRNPDRYIDDLFAVQYKPTKTWRGNWAEFTRDYIQFFAYCGILPCYFKGLNNLERDGKFFVSARGKAYIRGNISLSDILLKYKYRNALIDLEKYPEYNIRLRPFYITLKILNDILDKNIEAIEGTLLAATVSCMNDEYELHEAVEYISNIIKNKNSKFTTNIRFKKEAGRFLLLLKPYLLHEKLIDYIEIDGKKCFKIAEKGKHVLSSEPKNTIFFGDNIGSYAYTPTVGFLLNYFAKAVQNGERKLNLTELLENQSVLKNIVEKKKLLEIIYTLKPKLNPNPIKSIEEETILLNDVLYQYSINSGADFTTLHDSDFVEGFEIKPKDYEIRKIDLSKLAPVPIIDDIYSSAISSDGTKYEIAIKNALEELLGKDYVKHFGSRYPWHRLSDIVWKVPIVYDGLEKKLLIIIETKAGNAIRFFDERKEVDDIKKTIGKYKRELPDICGIWILILNGDSLPLSGQHGGFRGGGLSFIEKLNSIQQILTFHVQRPVIITAMNILSFIEYYKYLYSATRNFGVDFVNISEISINQFWIWGSLFKPVESYCICYDDPTEVKKGLFKA